ncbi:hypothetical protein CERZMDRAFT_100850 [Cercospora zeae-maydis SCOH1-5]|uniref:Uncharacterized protein n=1 Tax=Cercospora zeae-maydis SCOH1-5 TaxID=717836 RepID=A0A6A6F5K4_9PEZI|nr:hypothetical protein CERZMDRAFT_100850 [Cercospora zeae-maydis SCOH1-5]
MASLLGGSRVSRARFLQLLPPAVRSSSLIHSCSLPRRTFASTPRRPFSAVELATAVPSAILDTFHALGLPWCAAIPATAVLVRCTAGYYLGALPSRKRAIIRAYLQTLVMTTAKQKTHNEVMLKVLDAERRGKPLHRSTFGAQLRIRGLWNLFSERVRINQKFKAPLFRASSFINFGLFLAFAETIRIKCGHSAGMLSLMLHPLQKLGSQAPKSEPVLSYAEAMAQRMEQAQAAADAQAQHYASNCLPVDPKLVDPAYHFDLLSKSANIYTDHLDPTMVVEGVAWFQNLTLPDSTFILPAMLSAVMISGVFWRTGPTYTVKKPESRKIETGEKQEEAPSSSSSSFPSSPSSSSSSSPSSSSSSSSSLKPTRNRTLKSAQTSGLLEREAQRDLQTRQINAAFAVAEKLRTESKPTINPYGRSLFSNWTQVQKLGVFMAGLMFFLSTSWPAGILLYLIPNLIVGRLHTRWLDLKYPVPPVVEPCKRPMRVKVSKREF